MSVKNAIKINGAKYFTFQDADGNWVGDPLARQAIYTRTFIPIGRQYKMTDDIPTMVSILKTDNVTLKESQLSEETKKVFDKQKVPYEKDINVKLSRT